MTTSTVTASRKGDLQYYIEGKSPLFFFEENYHVSIIRHLQGAEHGEVHVLAPDYTTIIDTFDMLSRSKQSCFHY